jgi:hypothetical protein
MAAGFADAGSGLSKLVTTDARSVTGATWRMVAEVAGLCEGLDPLAPADENRLAELPLPGPIICISANGRAAFYSAGAFCSAG